MNKTQIKKLAEKSFRNHNLDEKTIKAVASKLKRSELKEYLNQLYAAESKQTVKVFIPTESEDNLKELYKSFKKIYPNKKILVAVDPNLLLGIRIENEDNIYELSLRHVLEDLVEYIKQKHD